MQIYLFQAQAVLLLRTYMYEENLNEGKFNVFDDITHSARGTHV
jgi:hypothetical protein